MSRARLPAARVLIVSCVKNKTPSPPAVISTPRFSVDRLRQGLRQIRVNPVAYCWIGLLFAFAALYRRLALADPFVLDWWFNSDTLYPLQLIVDFFRDGYPLSGWTFSIAPCWFPDVPVLSMFFALTGNVVLSNLLDGMLQFVLLILGFQMCWRALGLRETRLANCLTLLAGIGFVLCAAWRTDLYYPTVRKLLQPQTHVDTLVLVMSSAALCIRLFRGGVDPARRRIMLGCLAFLSVLGGMADPLFMPQMTFAMTVAAMVFAWLGLFRFRRILTPLVTSWLAILTGRILNKLLFTVGAISQQSTVTVDAFLTALGTCLRGAAAALRGMDLLHLSAALWLLVAAGAFLQLLRQLALGRVRIEDPPRRDQMVVFFLLFSALSGLCSLSAIVVGGSNALTGFKDYRWAMDHYAHSLFFEAPFGWAMLMAWILSRRRRPLNWHPLLVYGAMAAVVGIPAVYAFSIPSAATPLHSYSPPLVRYLDSQADRYGLRVGIAGYWTARPLSLFTRKGLRVYSVEADLTPSVWVSNKYWYEGTSNGSKPAPDYNFAVLDEPTATRRKFAVEKLGPADTELDFRGTPILVYKPSSVAAWRARLACESLKRMAGDVLKRAGNRLEIPASCLNGNVADIVGTTRVATAGATQPGVLSFGPYLSIPPGRYSVIMHLQVVRHNPGPAATWDLGYFCCEPTPPVKFGGGSIGDGAKEIRTQISVTPELAARSLEFRVVYLGAERLVLEKLTFDREQ